MNNMMFHYDNETPDEVTIFDYQAVVYNCFANDLQQFLFTSVSANVIAEHLDDLLERYYLSLKSAAPERPDITLERVKEEFFERLFFGYMMGVAMRGLMSSPVPPDMDEVISGKEDDLGFREEKYIQDLKVFLPIFEKYGMF